LKTVIVATDTSLHDTSATIAVKAQRHLAVAPPAAIAVENVRSINFAKNLREYRSPRLAMLMSLIVPGLGQAYTKHYLKAGLFVLVEAAIISYSVAYSQLGKSSFTQAKNFADDHYSYNTFLNYYNSLGAWFSGMGDTARLASIYDSASFHEFAVQNATKPSGLYQSLKEPQYIQGWKDCIPTIAQIETPGSDGTVLVTNGKKYVMASDTMFYLVNQLDSASGKLLASNLYGYSEYQVAFKKMMKKSNDYYSTANIILLTILINHVVSAVDALIGANAYNSALLGRETFWQHIRVEPQWVMAGMQITPGCAVKVQF
jgi:hypothetical protein